MNLQVSLLLGIIVLFLFLCSTKESYVDAPSNPNLIPNVGGPAWGQFIINPKLMPSEAVIGAEIKVGSTNPISIVPKNAGAYISNVTYYLGDVITYKGLSYICLASRDPRGPAFSGTYNASPEQDKNAWFKIFIVKHLTSDPVKTEQSKELEKKLNELIKGRDQSIGQKSPYVTQNAPLSDEINRQFSSNTMPGSNLNPSIRQTPISNPLALPGLAGLSRSDPLALPGLMGISGNKKKYIYSFDPEMNPETDC